LEIQGDCLMFKYLTKYNHILVTGPQRSGTTIAAKMIAKDTRHKYIKELARFGMSRHQAKSFRMRGGRVCDLKYKRWREEQRDKIPHYIELEYESLSAHPMWVPKERRVNFGGKQTEL